jgi:hypothetical protein
MEQEWWRTKKEKPVKVMRPEVYEEKLKLFDIPPLHIKMINDGKAYLEEVSGEKNGPIIKAIRILDLNHNTIFFTDIRPDTYEE